MTQFTPQPPYVAVPRTPRSVSSVVAIVLAVVTFVALVISKILSAMSLELDDTGYVVLGFLGLATIVPIIVVIVFGHVGRAATRTGLKLGLGTATAALAMGYVLLVLYLVRLINVATYTSINSVSGDDFFGFVRQIFYWA